METKARLKFTTFLLIFIIVAVIVGAAIGLIIYYRTTPEAMNNAINMAEIILKNDGVSVEPPIMK